MGRSYARRISSLILCIIMMLPCFSGISIIAETAAGRDIISVGEVGSVDVPVGTSYNEALSGGEYDDFVLEATLKGTDENINNNFGVMLRASDVTEASADSYHGYYVGIGKGSSGGSLVIGYADGKWHSVKPLPIDYKTGTEYKLKVLMYANTLTVWPDGKFMYKNVPYYIDAQEESGYFDTHYTLNPDLEKYSDVNKHELYCMGHFIEAAIAHYQYMKGTDTRLLDMAPRIADHIDATFGNGKRKQIAGHQEIELALMKFAALCDSIGESGRAERYSTLAAFFLDVRGDFDNRTVPRTPKEFWQDHISVSEQKSAVGHAVRAEYMCTAMAELASMDKAYREKYNTALSSLYRNVVDTKQYVTGGIGQMSTYEGFASSYYLPSFSAYCENCAGIANMLWNRSDNAVYVQTAPMKKSLLDYARPSASHFRRQGTVHLLCDGHTERSRHWTSWKPNQVVPEPWVQYEFDREITISGCRILWYNDKGGIRLADRLDILYRDPDGELRSVKHEGEFMITTDKEFEEYHFDQIKTKCISMVIHTSVAAAGIIE